MLCTKSEVSLNEKKSALFLSAFFSPNVIVFAIFLSRKEKERKRGRESASKSPLPAGGATSSEKKGDAEGEGEEARDFDERERFWAMILTRMILMMILMMMMMVMMTTTRMHTADAFSLADTVASHASYVLQKMKSRIVYDSTGQSAPTKSIEQIKIRGDSRDSVFETDDVAPMTEEEVEESLAEHEDAEEEGEEGPYVVRKTPSSDGGKIEEGEESTNEEEKDVMFGMKVSHNARWCGGQTSGFGWKTRSEAEMHRKSLAKISEKRRGIGRRRMLVSSDEGIIERIENEEESDSDYDENERMLQTMLKLNNATTSFVEAEEDDSFIENIKRRNTLALRALRGRRTRGGTGTTPLSGKYSQGYFGCERIWGKIKNENENKATRVDAIPDKELSPGLRAVKMCIKDISKCGADAMRGVAELPSTSLIHALPNSGKKKYNSCAIVGNAGTLLKSKAYGEAIDKHDIVMRFNVMTLTPRLALNVGTKTSFRMVNHLRSRHACCPKSQGGKGKMPEKGDKAKGISLILWHPGRQAQLLRACKKNIPNAKVSSIPESYIKKEVNVMNAMRKDLMRLGFGPFSDWKQGTSGFHGILLLTGMCDHLSLYGITSFSAKKGKSKGPDQYGGRGSKNMASWVWHDWEGEAYAWRLLHATGKATVCSNS